MDQWNQWYQPGFTFLGTLNWINQVTLTFPGAVSTNPDLQYFKEGDVVQSVGDDAYGAQKWCDTDYTDNTKWTSLRTYDNAFDGLDDTYCSPAAGVTVKVTYPDNYWYVNGDLTASKAGAITAASIFRINGADVLNAYDKPDSI